MKRITLTLLTFLGFCSQIAAQDIDNTNRLWDNKPTTPTVCGTTSPQRYGSRPCLLAMAV